jgi:hypothetical protein
MPYTIPKTEKKVKRGAWGYRGVPCGVYCFSGERGNFLTGMRKEYPHPGKTLDKTYKPRYDVIQVL